MSAEDLWQQTSPQLLRAERLLAHCLEALQEARRQRRRDRDRVALELELLLPTVEALTTCLSGVIEELAQDRQDNRLQRWQGQLQQLLTPLDSGTRLLRELLVQLDQPLADEIGADPGATRAQRQQQQLQQLLALRQKQVLQLQAEVSALQAQLFRQGAGPAPDGAGADAGAEGGGDGGANAGAEGGADQGQGSTPSIFS